MLWLNPGTLACFIFRFLRGPVNKGLLLTGSVVVLLPLPAQVQKTFGPSEVNGQKVLTFVGKDPLGQRCNNNMQIAPEIANVYRVPIQIVPSGVAGLDVPAPLLPSSMAGR